MNVFDIVIRYKEGIASGLLVTLRLSLIIWAAGLGGGALLGLAGHRWKFAFGVPLRSLAFGLSGLPILVLLYWLHFPLQSLLGVVLPPFFTASLALSVVNL